VVRFVEVSVWPPKIVVVVEKPSMGRSKGRAIRMGEQEGDNMEEPGTMCGG